MCALAVTSNSYDDSAFASVITGAGPQMHIFDGQFQIQLDAFRSVDPQFGGGAWVGADADGTSLE